MIVLLDINDKTYYIMAPKCGTNTIAKMLNVDIHTPCDLSNINNPYSSPSSIIYAINPSVSVGELISERPPNYSWAKLINGTYNELRLNFLGSDKSPINIRDPNMTIILTIKNKEENYNAS